MKSRAPRHRGMKPTQASRLLTWLRANPGASGIEIVTVLRIPKYTSRISDLRAAGYNVVCLRRPDGVDGYVVRVAEAVTTGTQAPLW